MNQEKVLEKKYNESYVLLVTVVDSDYSTRTIKAAEEEGAEECIILRGRGKRFGKMDSAFGMLMDLARDVVLCVAPKDKAHEIQERIFKNVGLKTDGHGFIYQLPITAINGVFLADDTASAPPGDMEKGGNV